MQRCALLALTAITLGKHGTCKLALAQAKGILPLLTVIAQSRDTMSVRAAIYCVGCVCEYEEVKSRVMDQGGLVSVLAQAMNGDIEIKRNVAYILALLAETTVFHDDLVRDGALDILIKYAALEDTECQEYAAFSLAHLSSNRDLQVTIAAAGAIRPLVAMMSNQAEPRHYAGLALLKLADNYENHAKIASEGGIQALLRLARARSTDEELQYKAALTVGHLASNAVSLLPSQNQPHEIQPGNSTIRVGQVSRKHAQSKTKEFLERSIKKTK